MKRLLPFVMAFIVLAGCGKKNDATPDPNANNPTIIIGKWKDGPFLSVYYTGGKEVYRRTIPAPTTVQQYYQFNSDGTFVTYLLTNGIFVVNGNANYSLTNANTTLHLSTGNGSADDPISFPDNNTLIITNTNTTSASYYINGVTTAVDKEIDTSTLYRM